MGVLQSGVYSCMDVSLGDKLMFLRPSIGDNSGFKKRNVRKVETLRTGCEVHACMPSILHSPLPENAFVSDIQSHRQTPTKVKRQGSGSYWTQYIVVRQRFCKDWKGESQ